MTNLDEDTIEKFLLYKNFKDISDDEVKTYIHQLTNIIKMYRKKIKRYKKFIELNKID